MESVIFCVTRLVNSIDRFTDLIGKGVSWLSVCMVVVVVLVVVMRYFLNTGSIALQEFVTYLHSLVFLLGIAYTLKNGGHVRVDIFYRRFSPYRKAVVDVFGGAFFLIPVSGFIFYSSWEYVLASWAIGETSAENNGLPFIYLLKTLMLLMPMMLFLQGIAEIIKSVLIMLSKSYRDEDDNVSRAHEKREPIL